MLLANNMFISGGIDFVNTSTSFVFDSDLPFRDNLESNCVCIRILQDCAVEDSEYFSLVFRDQSNFPPVELAVVPIQIRDDNDGEAVYILNCGYCFVRFSSL